ncbi:hypothetical protein COCNU_scaffold055320G000010 [Cocos nucifera]|nr:hypothetical protein [Cocos nucifera]
MKVLGVHRSLNIVKSILEEDDLGWIRREFKILDSIVLKAPSLSDDSWILLLLYALENTSPCEDVPSILSSEDAFSEQMLVVPPYSKLLHEDLLRKLHYEGSAPKGLTFSRKKLEGLASIDPPKDKKKKEKKKRRVIQFPSLEDVLGKAVVAEAMEQRER